MADATGNTVAPAHVEERRGAATPTDKLIHIADIHFWRVVLNPLRLLNKRWLGNLNVWLRRRHEFAWERAEQFTDTVTGAGIRHVVLTGDFTSTSTPEEFAMARSFVEDLRKRGIETFLLPGNHDVYTFEAARRERFQHAFRGLLPETGYPARVTLPGGTPIILTPTACPNFLTAKGRITEREIAATQDLLAAGPSSAIVAAHYPVLTSTHGYHTGPTRRLRNADRLRAALGESQRRILYVCGHVHRFSYTCDSQYPNLSHLSTGAFFLQRPKARQQGEFTEIHAHPEGWRVFHHRCMSGAWTRDEIQPLNP